MQPGRDAKSNNRTERLPVIISVNTHREVKELATSTKDLGSFNIEGNKQINSL